MSDDDKVMWFARDIDPLAAASDILDELNGASVSMKRHLDILQLRADIAVMRCESAKLLARADELKFGANIVTRREFNAMDAKRQKDVAQDRKFQIVD